MSNRSEKNKFKALIKEEYKKCYASPVYFMKKYCKIAHPQRGTIPFALYPFQEETMEDFKNHKNNIVLKCRQMGISTLIAGYSMWLMNFHKDKAVLVVAINKDIAKNLVTKVRVMHQHLPQWLKEPQTEDNKLSLRLANGSFIVATSSASDSARSYALSLLVVDECAFVDNMHSVWTSAQQTLATGGQSVLLSTPNGIGNFFHQKWEEAEESSTKGETGDHVFNPIKLHWTRHPEKDQNWRDQQTKLLGPRAAAQECDCDFLSSGNSIVDLDLLSWYEQTMQDSPKEMRGIDKGYWMWDYPVDGKKYMIAADVGRGDGAD
jgi:hypothetical protein